MPDKTQAEVLFSHLEYTSIFKRPILEKITPAAKLIAAVLDALKPAGYKLDGVEANLQVRKLDELSYVFRRTTPAAPLRSLTLGLGKVVVTADNLNWTEVEQFISVHGAALSVIREVGGAETESQRLEVLNHVQIKERSRNDVTAPLVTPVASKLLDGDGAFSGVILFRENTTIVIDASIVFANALFVRIFRTHPPEAPLAELAETLRKDEERIFDVLGLEGVL